MPAPRILSNDRGDGVVEFALAATVFFVTIIGILEFGQSVWRYNMLANLAQDGARRAIVCGENTKLSAGNCDVASYVATRSNGLLVSGDVTGDVTAAGLAAKTAGSTVSVQVQKSFTTLTTLIPHAAISMSATSKMIVVR